MSSGFFAGHLDEAYKRIAEDMLAAEPLAPRTTPEAVTAMTDPGPNDTNGDGDCGRKTCARCYPQYQPEIGGRWLELVPVEVFGLTCDDHDVPRPASWGLSDAVQAWSDCNRADGRIYRVEDFDGHRVPGETVKVWVADADLPFFERQWGDGYSTDPDVVDMIPPTAVREPLPKPELTAALIRDLAQMHSAVNLSFINTSDAGATPMTDNADNAQRRFLADMVAARRRAVFVAAALWLSFHGFGLLVLIYGGSMSPLVAALFYDGLAALGFGLWHLAKRIYP